jgi:uncharacterized membrane protein
MITFQNNFGFFRRRWIEPDRPMVRPEMAPVDWLMEVVALASLLFSLGFTIYQYQSIPTTIPTHFNTSGHADEFGGKESFLVLSAVGALVYAMLTLINLVPYRRRYMVRITQQNAMQQYTMAMRLSRTLKITLVWMFWYISFSTLRVSKGLSDGLGTWFLPVVLSAIFIPLIIYFIAAQRNK